MEIHKELVQRILTQKTKDYLYAILFFSVSSFFALFAIKPSLEVAFRLRRKAFDLKRAESLYNVTLNKLLDLQENMERVRDKVEYVDQAVPTKVEMAKVIKDIQLTAEKNGLGLLDINVEGIELAGEKDSRSAEIRYATVNLKAQGEFIGFRQFLKDIHSQRRLKVVRSIEIKRESKNATTSANLNINLQVLVFFL